MTDFSDNLCQRRFTIGIDDLEILTKITEDLPKKTEVTELNGSTIVLPENTFGIGIDEFNARSVAESSHFDLSSEIRISQNKDLKEMEWKRSSVNGGDLTLTFSFWRYSELICPV